MELFSLKNKTAIVTGGGSGIGKAIAQVFARQGANAYILDLDDSNGNAAAKEITDEGNAGFYKKCDISNQQQVKQVIGEIADEHGAIDILVNNAGVAHIGTAETTTEEDFNRIIQVNVRGVYNCIQATLPNMKTKGGSILNMASVVSSVGIPERFAYSMSKGAVVGMTLSVAKDFLKYNIRCNCISPARVHTPFVDGYLAKTYPGKEAEMFEKLSKTQPIGRMGKPEEVAFLALYLCSEEASFITGCDYPIDGGFIRLNN